MLDGSESGADATARRVVLASTVGSVGLLAGLVAAYAILGSRLALAQAADSFSDIFTASALLVAITISARPADDDHHFGHHRAEPIAALVAAILAGVLAVEVLRDAVGALLSDARPRLEVWLVAVFGAKVLFKGAIAWLAARRAKSRASPALHALHVDARNDVAVGMVAVAGYVAARLGWPAVDAWLAIPIALWVGWSGFDLARENVGLLMGEAPPEDRQAEIRAIASAIDGVRSVHGLRARYQGPELDVLVHVVVDPELRVLDAHDIGEAVERRLLEEPDVCQATAHLDVEPAAGA